MSNYDWSLLAYFDILGFKNLIDTKQPSEINNILSYFMKIGTPTLMTNFGQLEKEPYSFHGQKFLNFSDHIVRTTKIKSQGNKKYQSGIVFHEIFELAVMQASLIINDTLIRGCLTIGDVKATNKIIFGPALNRAYNLESNFAVFPRMIIDPMLLNELKETNNYLLRSQNNSIEEEIEFCKSFLYYDSDGLWFIDYLNCVIMESSRENEILFFLNTHKDVIQNTINSFTDINRVASKYLWLANYHNRTIKNLNEEFFDRNNVQKDSFFVRSTFFEFEQINK